MNQLAARLVPLVGQVLGAQAFVFLLVDEKLNMVPTVGTSKLTPLRGIFALSFINKIFPQNPISKSYWIKTEGKNRAYRADVIPGIFLIKKSIFQELGGFDEHFFLYFEDTDFFKRLKEKGYSVAGGQVNDGFGWASWRNRTDKILETFFPLKKKTMK